MRLFGKLRRSGAASIGPHEAKRLLAQGAVLLDVREPAEWAAGHAPEAVHVPLGQLLAGKAAVPADRRVVTVCRSGARSSRAAKYLSGQAVHVVNLRGGMTAWAAAGLPVVDGKGRSGTIA
ncbi:MAG TPA: rhodanese-like domain-containing protein [Mycobacteriales bacterium]|nr:rhodanese-like domain-containing protein [Mycobacteriales bacterium]